MGYRLLENLRASRDGPLFELALELERIALRDGHFIEKHLHPNVDFHSGIVYRALGIPKSMFTVMFAIARTVGGAAHGRKGVRSGVADRPAAAALYRAGPTMIRSMPAVDPARAAV